MHYKGEYKVPDQDARLYEQDNNRICRLRSPGASQQQEGGQGMKIGSVWPFLSKFCSSKAANASRGRKTALTDITTLTEALEGKKPRLWFHAASAGEFLQIRTLLEKMRGRYAEGAILVTFFSPSAERVATGCRHKDLALYLPCDSRRNVRIFLASFKPDMILFSKYDVWPNLAWEASKTGVKLGIVGATLHERSGRLKFGVSSLYSKVHSVLDFVGASTEDDAEFYMKLDVDPDHITVTGDMRYDQAFQRAMGVSPDDPLLGPLKSDAKVIVAGSTWPADEKLLLTAFRMTREKHRDIKLIIVPHEIKQQQLEEMLKGLSHRSRIKVNTRTGFILLDPRDVVHCVAEGNYTRVHFVNRREEIITSNLGSFMKQLSGGSFFRISRSGMINLNYLTRVDNKMGTCRLSADCEIDLKVARNRRSELNEVCRSN